MHFFGGHVVDAGSQAWLDGAGVAAVAFGALCDVVALLATLEACIGFLVILLHWVTGVEFVAVVVPLGLGPSRLRGGWCGRCRCWCRGTVVGLPVAVPVVEVVVALKLWLAGIELSLVTVEHMAVLPFSY